MQFGLFLQLACRTDNFITVIGHILSADSYEAHIKGKRHKKNLKLLEDEKNKMKHQAYVSWKKDIDKCHLESFALKFGPIKNIYVNKENVSFSCT